MAKEKHGKMHAKYQKQLIKISIHNINLFASAVYVIFTLNELYALCQLYSIGYWSKFSVKTVIMKSICELWTQRQLA